MDKWKIILEIFWFLEGTFYASYRNFKVIIYSHASRGSAISILLKQMSQTSSFASEILHMNTHIMREISD